LDELGDDKEKEQEEDVQRRNRIEGCGTQCDWLSKADQARNPENETKQSKTQANARKYAIHGRVGFGATFIPFRERNP
jgi:hypothetical protein